MTRHTSKASSAGVIAPPPVLFLGAWTAAAVLDRIAPLKISRADGGTRSRWFLGGALLGAGVNLSGMVVRHFMRASTPVSPLRATRALVTSGPYQFSRNPDYVGQALIYAGSSILRNRVWPLLLLPPALLLVKHGVIEREERYLERRFGSEYREYTGRVPRWV